MKSNPTLYVTRGSGNNIKPVLVANQLDLPCSIKFIDVLEEETRTPELVSIHPFMMLPNGSNLRDANAISWYLSDGSSLMPKNALSSAQAIRWINFEQSTLEANLSPLLFFSCICPDEKPVSADMLEVWRANANAGLVVLNDYLTNRLYITDCGFSVADIILFGYTHLASEWGLDFPQYKGIGNWMDRIMEQPCYRPVDELLNGTLLSTAA